MGFEIESYRTLTIWAVTSCYYKKSLVKVSGIPYFLHPYVFKDDSALYGSQMRHGLMGLKYA